MLRLQGINVIVAIIAVFVVAHLAFTPEQHTIRTTMSTLLGGVSFLLMTFSVVLATRLEIFEEMFGGLDRMYQVHRVAGTFTAVLRWCISSPYPRSFQQTSIRCSIQHSHQHRLAWHLWYFW